MSDTESIIPEEEIPKTEKKPRKKKEMTPEMTEQLRLARIKAMEVKKALKGNPEARIEHYKEKLKKQKEKPTKKTLLEKAKEQIEEEQQLSRTANGDEIEEEGDKGETLLPEPEPVPEPVKEEKVIDDDELDDNGLPKPPKKAIKKPIPEPEPTNFIDLSTDEKIMAVKEKKKVKYIYESDTDSEEERVVYVKKTHKKQNSPPKPRPVIPTTFGSNINRFGSYGMFGRR